MNKPFSFLAGFLGANLVVALSLLAFGFKAVVGSGLTLAVILLAWPVLLVVIGLVAGALDGGGEDVAEAGVEGGATYYRRLWRVRSPAFWGGLLGVLLCLGGLVGYERHVVRPREVATERRLDDLASALRTHRQETGRFPHAKGEHLHEVLGLGAHERWRGQPLVDAWGRPLRYERQDLETSERFTLRSSGYNGRCADGDDQVREGKAINKRAAAKQIAKAAGKKLLERLKSR